jgi:hypothetical protein
MQQPKQETPLAVRFTPAEKQALRQLALERGTTRHNLIRGAVLSLLPPNASKSA